MMSGQNFPTETFIAPPPSRRDASRSHDKSGTYEHEGDIRIASLNSVKALDSTALAMLHYNGMNA